MSTKNLTVFYVLILVVMLAMLTGCRSIETRTYVEEKERPDLDIDGNAGYIIGQPSVDVQTHAPVKKTRKFYVFEFTKNNPDEELKAKDSLSEPLSERKITAALAGNQTGSDKTDSTPSPNPLSKAQLELLTTHPPTGVTSSLPAQYTVQKNDTLQTISKKFYHSYRKWPQIYEANKEKISDPNHIRSGVVLTIPAI